MATLCFSVQFISLDQAYSAPKSALIAGGLPHHSMIWFRDRTSRSARSKKSTAIPRRS